LSFFLRPNNIGIQAALVIVQLILEVTEKKYGAAVRCLMWVAAGFFFFAFLILAWFWKIGALYNLFDAFILYNTAYVQEKFIMLRSLTLAFRRQFFFDGYLLLIYIALLLHVYIARRRDAAFLVKNKLILALLVGMFFEAVLSSLSARFLRHYYIIWTPYLGLMSGALVYTAAFVWFPRVLERNFGKHIYLAALIPVLLFGASPLFTFTRTAKEFWQAQHGVDVKSAVAEYINRMTEPNETVLVWGNEVWINFLSNRGSPTKYSYQYPLFMQGYTDKEKVLLFLQDISTCPPAYIVEPIVDTHEILPLSRPRREEFSYRMPVPDGMNQVYEFFDKNYMFEHEFNDVLVFVRIENGNQNQPCSTR
jgi:hypothetical protein